MAHFIPTHVQDRAGWAEDIESAIRQIDLAVTPERVCATVAVIGQESGFQVDRAVKNLPEIVRRGREKKFAKLGPVAGLVVKGILRMHPPGDKETFEQRISKLKTASELDRFEEYDIWKVVRSVWEKKTGKVAPYAILPTVDLVSPKLSSKRSTQWFASSVKHRYEECRLR